MLVPTELTFGQTVWASLLGALFTAAFVTLGGGLIVLRFQSREAERRAQSEADRALRVREAEQARADALLEADRRRADALLEAEARRADVERELAEAHDTRQQLAEHEFQTRAALRETYARLLVAQRRARQTSLALAGAPGDLREKARLRARGAHDQFIDEYHRLALDADRSMWLELRGLRETLDDMLSHAEKGELQACEALVETARATRQNLERSFRVRLGHAPLQDRKPTGRYDKT